MKIRLGLVIDQERCIGCEACTVACKLENNTKKHWIRVRTENVTQKDMPEGRFPNLTLRFLPQLCNHCDHPPCVDACPPGALVKREDGPVLLEDEACDGCQACIGACPFDAILYNEETQRAEKCNLCVHRTDQGLDPFCVICCEGQALHFGDLNDPNTQVSRMAAAKGTFQLGTEAGTNPSIYYCPPKAPKKL